MERRPVRYLSGQTEVGFDDSTISAGSGSDGFKVISLFPQLN